MAAAVPTAGPPRRGTARKERRTEAIAGYALIEVPITLFLVLNIGAIVFAFFISFWDWTLGGGAREVVGLENYQRILSDSVFQKAVYNSVTYALVVVPLEMALGLLLAVIVNGKIRG